MLGLTRQTYVLTRDYSVLDRVATVMRQEPLLPISPDVASMMAFVYALRRMLLAVRPLLPRRFHEYVFIILHEWS